MPLQSKRQCPKALHSLQPKQAETQRTISVHVCCRLEDAIAESEVALLTQSNKLDSGLPLDCMQKDAELGTARLNDPEAVRMREERQAAQMAQVSLLGPS